MAKLHCVADFFHTVLMGIIKVLAASERPNTRPPGPIGLLILGILHVSKNTLPTLPVALASFLQRITQCLCIRSSGSTMPTQRSGHPHNPEPRQRTFIQGDHNVNRTDLVFDIRMARGSELKSVQVFVLQGLAEGRLLQVFNTSNERFLEVGEMAFVEHGRRDIIDIDAELLDLWQEKQNVVHGVSAEARHVGNLDVFQILQRLDRISQQMLHREAFGKRTMLDDYATESLREADHTMEKMSVNTSTQADLCEIWRPVNRSAIVVHTET
jgi:hypothetical protein